MSRKIFITYKYGDTNVRALPDIFFTKVRDYVDKIQGLIDKADHINKGELDGESLEEFEDETIASSLRDKIYDSSITIVMLSPNMKTPHVSENDQWMPWEISYSLKEHSRNGRASLTNAVLAVALPDMWGSYNYYINYSAVCNSTMLNTNFLFQIMSDNMFNIKTADTKDCNGNKIFYGHASYIYSVTWDDFIKDINHYLNVATNINSNIADYKIVKSIS